MNGIFIRINYFETDFEVYIPSMQNVKSGVYENIWKMDDNIMHKNVHRLHNSNGHLALSLNTHAIFQLRVISLTQCLQCPCREKKVAITETAER